MTKSIPGLPRRRLVVTGQLCWDLLAPDTLYTDQVLWQTVTAELAGSDAELDNWSPKQCGEFLVAGSAAAPGGVPVRRMEVAATVGTLHKRVAVSGDRFWLPSLLRTHMTEAEPFSTMPLVYKRAFGGDGFPANPVGLGAWAQRRVDAGETVQLPNLEDPRRPVLHQDDIPAPRVFAPVDLAWPNQLGAAGTFDEAWLKQRYPLPPVDFDWRVYNVAPADQRLDQGFFAGDESVQIAGMHAGHEVIDSHLPGVTLRIFAVCTGSEDLIELPARLDTVWLFPSALKGVLLYRAAVDHDDADARDIDALMFACEKLHEPRPLAHYEQVYRLRTDPETKAMYALADDQLMPELAPEMQRELEEKREQAHCRRREKWRLQGEHFQASTAALAGIAMPQAAADYMLSGKGAWLESRLPVILPEDIARGNVDIAGIHRAADNLRQRADDMRTAALQLVPPAWRDRFGLGGTPPPAPLDRTRIVDLLGLQDTQDAAASKADELHALAGKLERDPMLSAQKEMADWMAQSQAEETAKARAMIRDKTLLSLLDESEAIAKGMAEQTQAPASEADPAGMRERTIADIRDMAGAFSQGVFAAPETGDPQAAILKALGIAAAPADMTAWPPGKLGALLQRSLRQAVERDGLAGMVELAGKLQIASLESLPPVKRAEALPQIERQIDHARVEAVSYKVVFPDADRRFAQAFADASIIEPPAAADLSGGMERLRRIAEEVRDPALRERIGKLISQSESMLAESIATAMPQYVKDGKPDLEQYRRDAAAQAMMLAGFKLPAQDGLPEDDWLTYDKRFACALAGGVIGRAGLPLMPPASLPASAAAGGTALFGLLQNAETAMRNGRRSAPTPFPQIGQYPAPVAAHLGEWVKTARREGRSLAGLDLAGADLRGADLRGADLRGTLLERADLSGALLDGARCDGSVLAGAHLARASLRGASFCHANLGQAQAERAIFAGTDLSGAQLYQADLSHCDLTDAVLDRVTAIECKLSGALAAGSRCAEAKFVSADLSEICLDGAAWRKVTIVNSRMAGIRALAANLEQCVWVQTSLAGGDLCDAQLHKSQFNDCDCAALDAKGVRANGTSWVKGNLAGAQFELAALDEALFESVPLMGANFRRARLIDACFMRSQLREACFGEAQLLRASFHNADLCNADLRFANLHGADFSDAGLDRADLTGCRRNDSSLEQPRANTIA